MRRGRRPPNAAAPDKKPTHAGDAGRARSGNAKALGKLLAELEEKMMAPRQELGVRGSRGAARHPCNVFDGVTAAIDLSQDPARRVEARLRRTLRTATEAPRVARRSQGCLGAAP